METADLPLDRTDAPTDRPMELLEAADLPPPEPLKRTLERLADPDDRAVLVQTNHRVPQHLYPRLEERGYEYDTVETDGGVVTSSGRTDTVGRTDYRFRLGNRARNSSHAPLHLVALGIERGDFLAHLVEQRLRVVVVDDDERLARLQRLEEFVDPIVSIGRWHLAHVQLSHAGRERRHRRVADPEQVRDGAVGGTPGVR